ncbi:MAG: hypothetical protein IIT72_07135 [Lachnospiraceae bacterium]|nr:hypothetical protein [Lachnospiraceae bacterium]MBQ5485243.1 hypothetical protein [Lachnospiraceae bacterium]MEE3355339.1 hypothetical protein [Candidatus Weimeria sp.]
MSEYTGTYKKGLFSGEKQVRLILEEKRLYGQGAYMVQGTFTASPFELRYSVIREVSITKLKGLTCLLIKTESLLNFRRESYTDDLYLPNLSNMEEARDEILKRVKEAREAAAEDKNTVTGKGKADSPQDFKVRVEKLQILRESGMLSEEEFLSEKKKLLDEI